MGNVLDAAIDQLVGCDPATMPDAALRAEIVSLRRSLDRLEHRYASLLAVADRRLLAWADGHGSTPAWMQAKTGTARRDAKHALSAGLALESLPLVDKAWAQGEISTSAAAEIAAGRHAEHGDVYGEIEETLVGFAAGHQWRELRATIAHYRSCCDALDDREPSDRNGLYLAQVQDRWSLDGDLDALAGHTLDTALKAAAGPPIDGDERDPAKRRADALVDIARYYLDHGDLPLEAQRAPHITIGIDLPAALAALPCPELRVWDGPTVSPAQLGELSCDANIARMVVGADGVPLAMGREVRDATRAQRRAAARRDGGCRFPGCDRPAWRCHPHHVQWWERNGPTDLDNLVCLCAFHHHVIHRAGWRATFDGITFTVWNPDGQLVGHTLNQGLPPPAQVA